MRASWDGEQTANEKHHLLPKKFKKYFERAGLDIEDYTVPLEKATHRLKPEGIHTGSENWNKIWDNYIEANPNAKSEQILHQLAIMKEQFGL